MNAVHVTLVSIFSRLTFYIFKFNRGLFFLFSTFIFHISCILLHPKVITHAHIVIPSHIHPHPHIRWLGSEKASHIITSRGWLVVVLVKRCIMIIVKSSFGTSHIAELMNQIRSRTPPVSKLQPSFQNWKRHFNLINNLHKDSRDRNKFIFQFTPVPYTLLHLVPSYQPLHIRISMNAFDD